MTDDAPAPRRTAPSDPSNPFDIPDIRPAGAAVPAVSVHPGRARRRRLSDEQVAAIRARHRRERIGLRVAVAVTVILFIGAALCGVWWASFLL